MVLGHWPGNLGAIGRYFTSGNHPAVGLGNGLRFMAAEFRFVPPWLGGANRLVPRSAFVVPAPLGWLAVPVALVATVAFALRRSRRVKASACSVSR